MCLTFRNNIILIFLPIITLSYSLSFATCANEYILVTNKLKNICNSKILASSSSCNSQKELCDYYYNNVYMSCIQKHNEKNLEINKCKDNMGKLNFQANRNF